MLAIRPFEPRPTSHLGIARSGDWIFKVYAVQGRDRVDWRAFDTAWTWCSAELPRPAVDPLRAGVGFLILHAGDGDYFVCAWWDNQNELPCRVFIRRQGAWAKSGPRESFCVWDLEIMKHERDAYIRHMMAGGPNVGAYVTDVAGAPWAGPAIEWISPS